MSKFPSTFLWGGATAANQYEGGYNDGKNLLPYDLDNNSHLLMPELLLQEILLVWNQIPCLSHSVSPA